MRVKVRRLGEYEDERKRRRKDSQPEAPAYNRLERVLVAGSAGFMHDDVASAICND